MKLNTEACAVALGTFDGLHPGHRAVIKACIAAARELGVESAVYTFYENPKRVFGRDVADIMTPEQKFEGLKALGIDKIVAVHFTKTLASVPAREFIEALIKSLKPKAFICGEDYTFGSKGLGNAEVLREICEEKGIMLKVVPLVNVKTADGYSDEKISSSLIRASLSAGDNLTAQRLINGEPI